MSRLIKKVLTVGLAVVTVIYLSGTAQAALTQSQIDAIVSLLQSFGADATTITNVKTSLTGGTPTTGGTTAAACSFTKDLTLGSTGTDVQCLQRYLNAAGYAISSSGAGSPGQESTYFGSLTKAAVVKWQTAMSVSPAAGYFGSVSRAKYATVAGTTGGAVTPPPGVVVPSTGLSVTVASDSPAAGTVPLGAANVPFLRFNVAGTGTVNYIVVQRVGAGKTTDLSNVYLYDGSTRLTAGRSVNSSTHQATFTGLNLAVSGVKTLTVTGDIATNAGAGDNNAFRVVEVNSTVAVSGVPVTGNEMSVSNATAGTLTIAKSGSLTNPNIGTKNALLSQFKLDAANEDVKVSRIALFYTGTVSRSYLTNFVLKDTGGNTLATAAALTAKDLAVFELASPVTILKGDSKTYYVYGDIGGLSKKDETIEFYVDEASDVYGLGQQYGYGATVTNNFNSTAANHHKLTLQGGTLTTSFLGPNTGDVKKNGKDVTLFEFTMTAASNLEIKKLNASVATTAGAFSGDDSLGDLKVVDVDTGLVVAGPVDLALAGASPKTGNTFTDIFNVNAGQTRKFKVTADIPNNWDDADAIRVSLTPFTAASDVKNLDNNTLLAAAEIVPSTVLTGNTQTVKAPTIEISLAGTPVSQSFVKGTQLVPFVGIGLRAIADDITVKTIKVTSSSSSVTDDDQIADVQNIALYDGDTRISEVKSLTSVDASSSNATFTNLNFKIAKGASKVLTLKGNLSASAVTNNKYEVGIATATTTNNTTGSDVVANDSEGNEPTYLGSFAASGVNMASAVQITVLSGGTMSIATAPDDVESKAGVLVTDGGVTQQVLGKFRFTARNESLTVKKLKLLINNESSTAAAATSTAEVTKVYLYDGGNLIGNTSGYTPIGSGSTAGDVVVEDLNWTIAKDTTKTLTVKGNLNTIANGATSGRSIYAHVKTSSASGQGFEASGAATVTYSVAGAKGNEKVAYKTYPAISTSAAGTLLTSGSNDLLNFTVTNKSTNEQLSWNVVSFNISAAAATVPLFGANTAAFTLRDTINSVNLTIGTTATGGTAQAGTYILYITNEEQIPAGGSRNYLLSGTVTAPGSNSSISTQLVLRVDTTAASIAKGVAFRTAVHVATAGQSEPSGLGTNAVVNAADSGFVWSDNSATAHGLTTTDWANGVYIDTYPSTTHSRSN